ncbi:MAG TPA: LacI family transcriptional regulator, partial [Firmicutes bacterium]|nr:LacI family transcriptional regulator [Bacillota bacterium]
MLRIGKRGPHLAVTIKDIAERAGVSVNTVSRALNNKPEISPETREKIIEIARSLNYTPNILARSLVLKQTYTLGLVVPDNSDPFYAQLAKGVEATAIKRQYNSILCNTDENPNKEIDVLKLLREKRVDGILITTVQKDAAYFKEMLRDEIPFVFLNRHMDDLDVDYVVNDNVAGAYEAVSFLIQLGHKRIAHITGPAHLSSVREREKGYRKALEDHGLEASGSLIFRSDSLKIAAGYNVMKSLLASDSRITAVFAFCDLLAIGAYKAIIEAGLNVPGDISIIGYDDIEFAEFLEVPLTTVAQPTYEIGQIGTEILIERLKG